MKPSQKVTFKATIEQHPGMDAGYIVFPYDVKELYGVKGQVKVKALFDDVVLYRGSLAKMGLPCHVLGITKEVRFQLEKTFGDEIKVVIEQDTDEREVAVPEDVAILLKEDHKSARFYESLSYTDKKEFMRWIENARQSDTRTRRITIFLEKMKAKKRFMDL